MKKRRPLLNFKRDYADYKELNIIPGLYFRSDRTVSFNILLEMGFIMK